MTNFNLTGDILHIQDVRPVLEQRLKSMRAAKGYLKSQILQMSQSLKSKDWDTEFRIDFLLGGPEGLSEKIAQTKQELMALDSAIKWHRDSAYDVSRWGSVTVVGPDQRRYQLPWREFVLFTASSAVSHVRIPIRGKLVKIRCLQPDQI